MQGELEMNCRVEKTAKKEQPFRFGLDKGELCHHKDILQYC